MISTRHTMIKNFSYSAGQWWGTTFNPALGKHTKVGMRPDWSSQQDPRQPGLYRETLSQHTKRTSYSTFKRKRHLMSKQPGMRFAKWMEKALLNSSVLITIKKASLAYSLNHLMPLALHSKESTVTLSTLQAHISDPCIGKKSYLIQETVWDIFIFLNFHTSI